MDRNGNLAQMQRQLEGKRELKVVAANGVAVVGTMEAWLFAILNALSPEQFALVMDFVAKAPAPLYVATTEPIPRRL